MTKSSVGILTLFILICLTSACEKANQPIHSTASSVETVSHSETPKELTEKKLVNIIDFDGKFQIEKNSMVLTWFPLHPEFGLFYPDQWYNLQNQVTISIMPDNSIPNSDAFITDNELNQFSDYMGSIRDTEHKADFYKLQFRQSSAILKIKFQDSSNKINNPILMDILGNVRFISERDQAVNKSNNDRDKVEIEIRVYEGDESKPITVAGAQEDSVWAFTGHSDFGFYVPPQLEINEIYEGFEFRTLDHSGFIEVLDADLLPIPKLLYKLDELTVYSEYIGSTRSGNRQDDYFAIAFNQSNAYIRLSFTGFEAINENRAILLDVMNGVHYVPKPFRGVTNVP